MTRGVDPEGFRRVYDEHVWTVYGFFGYRVASRADAEDLTQLTFERAFKAWHRFDERKGTAAAWLMSIARNLLVDHYRRDASRPEEPAEDPGSALSDEAADPELGISPELMAALATLGTRERELIALRYGADLKGKEIAELTGLTLANVQQILSRSLRKLHQELAAASRSSE
jgi:RNA polymerase sigma factor (sigma-70 family)